MFIISYKRHYMPKRNSPCNCTLQHCSLPLSTFLSAGGLGLRDNVHTSTYLKISVMVHTLYRRLINTPTFIIEEHGSGAWSPTHTEHPYTYVGASLPTGGLVYLPLTHLQTVVLVHGNLLVDKIVWLLILKGVEVRHIGQGSLVIWLWGKEMKLNTLTPQQ